MTRTVDDIAWCSQLVVHFLCTFTHSAHWPLPPSAVAEGAAHHLKVVEYLVECHTAGVWLVQPKQLDRRAPGWAGLLVPELRELHQAVFSSVLSSMLQSGFLPFRIGAFHKTPRRLCGGDQATLTGSWNQFFAERMSNLPFSSYCQAHFDRLHLF